MASATRDLRADVCRGLALWMIMVNHMPGNLLGAVTLKNFAFADATEAFVFLAGYAGAFAYAGQADRQGFAFAAAALLRRIGVLYVAHIFLLVLFTAQVGLSAATLDRAFYLDELALDPFAQDPYRTLIEALLLRFQPHFLDILPLYIVLLGLLIPALLLRDRGWWLLGLSAALWAWARWFGVNLPRINAEGWFFNPLGWQLLFICGFLTGQAVRGRPGTRLPPRSRLLTVLAVLVVFSGFAWMQAWERLPGWEMAVPEAWAGLVVHVDKTALHPARLASLLALAYLIGHHVPRDWPALDGPWLAPFLRMGQHSLPVFCAGILISFLGRLMLEVSDGWVSQLYVNLTCFGLLVAVAQVAHWYRAQERGGRPAALPARVEVR
ncbi:MAG: OpgC domain-containing protein [Acetobacteraceae bacterium]|nr:OpgC domain-containing protein [Acetobacteraceae bacterium]